ncbi:MAG: TetR family transcriptional regulator [Chlamydiota bacterium]
MKEKIERRELILNSAMTLIRSSGMEGLAMRKLADLIEYSPCVVYETFPNKDSLIHGLFSIVCDELWEVLNSICPTDNPEIYFRKLIGKDIEFMTNEPHRVELFTIVNTQTSPNEFPPSMQKIIHLIGKSLKNLGFQKLSTEQEITDAQDIVRTFLGGILKLSISQRSGEGLSRCNRILENGLTVLLDGWRK